jgi:antitoxin YobK
MRTEYENFCRLLIEMLENEEAKENIDICKSQSEAAIKKLEKELQLKLPSDYKLYLRDYGQVDFYHHEIYGIPWNPDQTLGSRGIEGFLDTYLVVYGIGDGSLICLDTSKNNGDCPVILWDFDGTNEIISTSFGSFLLETFWNTLIEKKIDLRKYQHLKPSQKGWNHPSG